METHPQVTVGAGEEQVLVPHSSYVYSRVSSIGIFAIRDTSSDVICLFVANNDRVDLLSAYYNITTKTKDTPNSVNIYMDNGAVMVQNLTSISRTFLIHRYV